MQARHSYDANRSTSPHASRAQVLVSEVSDLAPSYAISALLLELLGGPGGSPDEILLRSQQAQRAPAHAQLPISGFGAPTGALPLAHEAQLAALKALLRLLHCVPAGEATMAL